MQARHEYKHSLNYADYILVRSRLRRTMRYDEHANSNGEYLVRSLYFDTPNDNALADKINGVDRREKFRIRRYLGGTDYIVLEKKCKAHGLCYKEQAEISREKCITLQNGALEWMKDDPAALVRELYVKMVNQRLTPKTIVDYRREPFICAAGNVRVTLDREIRTGLSSTDFLNDDLPTIPENSGMVLLEVKYDQFIPDYIVRALQLGNRSATACSKYALCRMYD